MSVRTAVDEVRVASVRLDVLPVNVGTAGVSVTMIDKFVIDVPAMLDADTCTVYTVFRKAPCNESVCATRVVLFTGLVTTV